MKGNTFTNLGLWCVLITSKTGKYLCFFVLMYMDVLFIFLVWKFLDVYYFNYVECKFDNALHLFLYFLNLLLLQPVWFAVPLHISVMYTVCLSLQAFQGWKQNKTNLQQQLVLKVSTPLLLWKRKIKQAKNFFFRFWLCQHAPTWIHQTYWVPVSECIMLNHIIWMYIL